MAYLEQTGAVRMTPGPLEPTAEAQVNALLAMNDRPQAKEGECQPKCHTELHATAERLLEEQAALRRVATFVAGTPDPHAVFDLVTREASRVLDLPILTLLRFEPDRSATVMAAASTVPFRVGVNLTLGEPSVINTIFDTGLPARIASYEGLPGAVAAGLQASGAEGGYGVPIHVEGTLWGAMAAVQRSGTVPDDAESRLASFTDLVATAIASAQAREAIDRLVEEQAASRTRLLTAADDGRRRVVRDLHDGAQQRLVHAIVTLKLARRAVRESDGKAKALIDEALEQAEQTNVELRELAHGILPSTLTRGGLQAGVEAVVSRLDLAVDLNILRGRFPAEVEASAYFIIAEALTNVVKHADATRADVKVLVDSEALVVEVRDDGIGGADPSGHGLVGLADRATALGGSFQVDRLLGGGTLVAATLPLSASANARRLRGGLLRPSPPPRG